MQGCRGEEPLAPASFLTKLKYLISTVSVPPTAGLIMLKNCLQNQYFSLVVSTPAEKLDQKKNFDVGIQQMKQMKTDYEDILHKMNEKKDENWVAVRKK